MNKLIILVVLACVIGSLAQTSNDKGSQCESYIFQNRFNNTFCALNK